MARSALARAVVPALVVVLASACTAEPNEVFVPGPGFSESLRAWSEGGEEVRVRAGEPLVLHAERRSGPWRRVALDGLDEDACWLVRPPAELEADIGSRLRWVATPTGHARFNLDFRPDGARVVVFDAPGEYELVGYTSDWCAPEPYSSNRIRVRVLPAGRESHEKAGRSPGAP